jgi:hypothetical protein
LGAFFLFQDDIDIDEQAVDSVFNNKGFSKRFEFKLGRMRLWLYPKQLLAEENYILDGDGTDLYATGTVVYQGLSYRSSLQALLNDYKTGDIKFDRLLGNYCLIFYNGKKIQFLTDRLNVQHIFVDNKLTRLTTSFLAMLASFQQPGRLNRLACFEKMMTGYIVGPDTLVEGIHQVTPQLQGELCSSCIEFLSVPAQPVNNHPGSENFNKSVTSQLDTLFHEFRELSNLAITYGVDFGLSSGYDSRLILALAKQARLPASVHSHLTKGVHESEANIAREMAEVAGMPFRSIETLKIEDYGETELLDMLSDGLYYYDGRTGDNSGALSPTYTRKYKAATLADRRLRLNGEGGEIYRNYYYTSAPRVEFYQWMKNHLFYRFAEECMTGAKKMRDELDEFVLGKISRRLGLSVNGWVDQLALRRYYGEIRLPDCEGFLANADNQLAFFIFPFVELSLLEAAYTATPFIGVAGRYEAAMIERLDAEIASFPSHYGFPLNRPPFSYWLNSAARGYIPDRFWNWRKRRINAAGRFNEGDHRRYLKLRQVSPVIPQVEDLLGDLFPEINLQPAMRHAPQRSNLLYLGYFLYEFQHKLH